MECRQCDPARLNDPTLDEAAIRKTAYTRGMDSGKATERGLASPRNTRSFESSDRRLSSGA